jgi:predicted nucleotidyltransferase
MRPPTIDTLREAILGMDSDVLAEAEGIGICGSIARGEATERSDIDIFVILDRYAPDADEVWYHRLNEALSDFRRDVSVLVYPMQNILEVSNWYVLRLASDGIVVYDRGNVRRVFDAVIAAARQAGLVQKRQGNGVVWTMGREMRPGEIFEVKVEGW